MSLTNAHALVIGASQYQHVRPLHPSQMSPSRNENVAPVSIGSLPQVAGAHRALISPAVGVAASGDVPAM